MKAGKKPGNVTTRRLFFWRAGAALSAPLAVAGAQASPRASDDREALRARLALLEDRDAIADLNRAFARHLNEGAHAKVASLFADPMHAPAGTAIRYVPPQPFERHDAISIAPDHRSATARIHCTVRLETTMDSACTLVQMARQQGGGVLKRAERAVFENTYVKRRGGWKIERSAYRPA